MAMFLRFRKRGTDDMVLINMDHVLRIEPGGSDDDAGTWSRLLHMAAASGSTSASAIETEVTMSFEELSSVLAGVWEKDASLG